MIKKIALLIICLVVLMVATIGCAQSPLVGKWYEVEGRGAIDFSKGGKCMVYITDIPLEATYTYDNKTSTGVITIDFLGDITEEEFTLDAEAVIYQGQTYTTEYVELVEFGDALDDAFDDAFDELGDTMD